MKKIALLTETSRGFGRDFLNGVAQFAQEQRDWLMRLLNVVSTFFFCMS